MQHEASQGTWNWELDLGANTKEPAKSSEKGGGSEVWKIHITNNTKIATMGYLMEMSRVVRFL